MKYSLYFSSREREKTRREMLAIVIKTVDAHRLEKI